MSNPFRPVYTESQAKRVADERARLLARWIATPALREGQPAGFAIAHDREEIDGSTLVDVFVAKPAAAGFSDAWRREIDHNLFMSVEHGQRQFSVRVRHAYYLERGWSPVSVDGVCFRDVCSFTLVALLAGVVGVALLTA